MYYTRYLDSALLFKSFTSGTILKIDAFGSSEVGSDNYEHFNYYFSTFRKDVAHCLGVIGVLELATLRYVIAAKSASICARLGSNVIYTLRECEFLPLRVDAIPASDLAASDDHRYLALVKSHLSSCNLLFCESLDLSNNLQKQAKNFTSGSSAPILNLTAASPTKMSSQILSAFNESFFWNAHLLSEIRSLPHAADFVIPLVHGFAECAIIKSKSVETAVLCVLLRRSTHRAGTRYFKRGADLEGNVANFNETEQILLLLGEKNTVLSHLQFRGSIPLHWAEINTLQYKPSLAISASLNIHALVLHFQSLTKYLPGLRKVFAVNLVNSLGHEKPLKEAYESTMAELASQTAPSVNYIYFDFHQQCSKFRYQNLSMLVEQLRNSGASPEDYFEAVVGPDGVSIVRSQESIIRTNCMDCLDRTNVVQSVFGKWVLGAQLISHNFDCGPKVSTDATLSIAFAPGPNEPSYIGPFNGIWTNNGDSISRAYSGTGALKSGFTKTGKRTIDGALKDLVNSIVRYFKNNFRDGSRQDAYDLVLGRFRPSVYGGGSDYRKFESQARESQGHRRGASIGGYYGLRKIYYPSNINMGASPFSDARPFQYQLVPYVLLLTTALFFSVFFFPKSGSVWTWSNLIILGACLAVISWLAWFIIRNGIQYVAWPKLCEVEFLRKKMVIGNAEDGDDGVEGFEYVVAEDFAGTGKMD